MLLRKKVLRVGQGRNLAFWSRYNAATIYRNLQKQSKTKEVFTMQEAWLSPKTFPTMFHCKTFGIITWLPPSREDPYQLRSGQPCRLSNGNRPQYPAVHLTWATKNMSGELIGIVCMF